MTTARQSASDLPAKINIGCGFDLRPGYLNVDSGAWHNPDLVADVTDLSMLPSGHFSEAVAQDVLEHISREKQVTTLREWGRLLRDGGLLHVRVPSVVHLVRMLAEPPFKDNLAQHHTWVQMLYGTQAYPGDFHLCGYTHLTLVDLGQQAGLFLSRVAIVDRWLFDTSFKKVPGFEQLTNKEWLAHAYLTVLHEAPDPDGLAYWTEQLDLGHYSRAGVIEEFTKVGTTVA